MNIEQLREYCLTKPATTEDFPFDQETLVFKVFDKIFALTSIYDVPLTLNLKCDPEYAVELREKYVCVIPGYHMNKKHWNTVILDGTVPDSLICDWINHSYELIVANFTGKQKQLLKQLEKE